MSALDMNNPTSENATTRTLAAKAAAKKTPFYRKLYVQVLIAVAFASGAMLQGTMQSLIAFVGYNVVFGAISGSTDNACHFGGLAAGVVLGALIAKFAPEPRQMSRLSR